MKTLTIEGLKDFQTCALLHKYRHLDDQPEAISARELLGRRYHETMKLVTSFFFYKKQSGQVPSYSALLNRWERLWFPKGMETWDLLVESQQTMHGNLASFTTSAAAGLLKLYEEFSEDDDDPIMINEKFSVPIEKNVKLEGEFDLVLRNSKTKHFRVVQWTGKGATKITPIDWAALKYAFDYRNEGKFAEATYHSYAFNGLSSPWNLIAVEDEDITALKYWVSDYDSTDHFVPRRGLTYYCKKCPFDTPCSKFSYTDMLKDGEE